MPEQFLVPMIGVFGPLFIATIAAYLMLNRNGFDSRNRR